MHIPAATLPVFLFLICAAVVAAVLLLLPRLTNPSHAGRVGRMPYESGMDPVHDTRRRFDVRFHLIAIAFLVFDVEVLFLYPWAVATRPAVVESTSTSVPIGIDAAVASGAVESRHMAFAGAMVFIVLLAVGFIYDWRKGIFRWR